MVQLQHDLLEHGLKLGDVRSVFHAEDVLLRKSPGIRIKPIYRATEASKRPPPEEGGYAEDNIQYYLRYAIHNPTYTIRRTAVVFAAAGKMIVRSPAVTVLSAPKSRTATAALVRVVFAVPLADGVVL